MSAVIQWLLILIALILTAASVHLMDAAFAILLVLTAVFLRVRSIHKALLALSKPVNVINHYEP